MNDSAPADGTDALFSGPGEARLAARRVSWAATPLGPPGRWPQALRHAARLCLACRTPGAIWAGPALTLVYNDGYVPVLGPTKHPWAMGRPLREIWPEVLDQIGPEFRRVVEEGVSTRYEEAAYRVHRGGREEEAFFTYTLTPIREEDGRIVGVFNVMEELTGTVRARTRSEEFLAFALGTASLGAWELDVVDGSARRSLEHDRIFGYDRLLPEWTYARFLEHVVPEDRAEVDRRYRNALAGRQDWTFECRIRRTDGELRWIWAAGRHRADDAGAVRRLAGIVQDITERKRAEERLRRSEARLEQERARLQAILDTIPVGLFIAEASGKVVVTNDEAKRIWAGAVPLDRIEEYGSYVGFWPETGERLAPDEWPAAQALLHGRRTKQIVDIERFDGTRGTIVFAGAPIQGDAGAIDGAVVAIQDISELRAAQARLEEADRRKNHFLAVLSHELRNPLTPVKNSLYILDRVPPGGDQAQRAKAVIERQIDQLCHLVDDLLDVTRITRGKIQLQRTPLELNELVRRTIEDHRTLFESSGLHVRLETAPAPVVVDADWNRVAQVIGNLLLNAAKFTPSGGEVTAAVSADPAASEAVVRIADTGAGIAPEVLARLFEPFMQADETLDRSRGGLGLGLALVKGLVELHGGTIEARSDGVGRGSEFTVRLPLAAADPAGSGARAATARVRRRILVVEDNVDAAESLRDLLALDGHEVEVAHDGVEGVARARALRPDVVLCDIGLPGMDGYAVARALRADPELRGARLVALSGYALPEDVQRALEAGFERHVAKPPTREKLEAVLGSG